VNISRPAQGIGTLVRVTVAATTENARGDADAMRGAHAHAASAPQRVDSLRNPA
jgi:hypothetical protein